MSAVKKVCINSSKNYYTGSELSPLHYGLSAEGYDINSIMEGYDKELWIVDVKNNKKVWGKNDHLSRITHEEPVIKNILSLYCDTEEIEKINQLKQKCGKDGSYNLKDINKFYNLSHDDVESEKECSGIAHEDNTCAISFETEENQSNKEENCVLVMAFAAKETLNSPPCITGCNTDDIIKESNNKTGGKSIKRTPGTIAKKANDVGITTAATAKENKGDVDDKKPTDYNIFVKFRLNELKEISTNKKDNFENVKIEWRELKKNKNDLKIVIEKAYAWLNHNK